jgi:transposase-like protein
MEVITGVGRRRRWTLEDKARIVAESLDPGTTASLTDVLNRIADHKITRID